MLCGIVASMELGNHVYHATCSGSTSNQAAVWVRIPWRRQTQPDPKITTCTVIDASGSEVRNRVDLIGKAGLNRFDAGEVAF